MAPKRNTRPNPNPNSPPIVDYPEKLLRKLKSPHLESGAHKLVRTTSFLNQLFTAKDLSFDIQFELSIFRSNTESFLLELVFDPI